ncbi:DUF4136 domain-containing protein [Chitinophaga sedimenti]|uniref:DUF4136 domain-containing protein n=1 Tax=Chitinophaga sedimenti TaxID=2033606 RepID=UPI00200573E7|nr:DUF4136 domain-containing protein [Chitinophaga sedimenti]MCK7558211.1 DUF4136 domain-containing protein [Chitinophaga sedimenti]
MLSTRIVFYTLCLWLLSACNTLRLEERVRPKGAVRLSDYKTFSLREEWIGGRSERDGGQNHLLRWELVRQLQLCGLRESPDSADIVIAYSMGSFIRTAYVPSNVMNNRGEVPYLQSNYADPVPGRAYRERVAVLKIYDKKREGLVWRTATKEVLSGPEKHVKAHITGTASLLLKKLK